MLRKMHVDEKRMIILQIPVNVRMLLIKDSWGFMAVNTIKL